jgi:hypothetical protein
LCQSPKSMKGSQIHLALAHWKWNTWVEKLSKALGIVMKFCCMNKHQRAEGIEGRPKSLGHCPGNKDASQRYHYGEHQRAEGIEGRPKSLGHCPGNKDASQRFHYGEHQRAEGIEGRRKSLGQWQRSCGKLDCPRTKLMRSGTGKVGDWLLRPYFPPGLPWMKRIEWMMKFGIICPFSPRDVLKIWIL